MMLSMNMKRAGQAMLLGFGMIGASTNQADAALILSVESPKVQTSSVAGVTTETFDGYPVGKYSNVSGATSAVGTFTSPGVAVVAANQYGGAGGTGNYFAIGVESGATSATLTFNGAQSYFGFWWSAADSLNSVDLYSAGKLLGSFSSATALSSLSSDYNGNPNGLGDPGEKFAYLDFTGTNGTTIDQVVFRNASLSTGFELDNISIRSAPLSTPPGTIINGGIAVPEPSSLAMASIAGLFGAGTWVRNRKRSAARA